MTDKEYLELQSAEDSGMPLHYTRIACAEPTVYYKPIDIYVKKFISYARLANYLKSIDTAMSSSTISIVTINLQPSSCTLSRSVIYSTEITYGASTSDYTDWVPVLPTGSYIITDYNIITENSAIFTTKPYLFIGSPNNTTNYQTKGLQFNITLNGFSIFYRSNL